MPPILAGTIITRLRGKVPDGVWLADVAQPDADGKTRVALLYGWLDDGIQQLTQLTGWTLSDWWAVRQIDLQPWYAIDPLFVSMESAFSNQFQLNVVVLEEADTIWPNSQGPMATQPLSAYVRKLGSDLSVGLWPVPPDSDPTTTLVGAITATTPDPITLVSTTDFLTYGYVLIDAEIIQYQSLTATTIGVLSRGIGGTTAAIHADGATVTHLGFWIKGRRLPTTVTGSLSPVEVPRGWISHLETYVLGQIRLSQKGRETEGHRLIAHFEKACAGINADPNWKVNMGIIRAWGDRPLGPIYPYGQGVIVP
jgi:hypothetical protein